MHRFRISTLPLIAALMACIGTLAACEDDPGPAVTVADSAGVRITLSPDSPKTFAEVDPQPVVSIGGADDTEAARAARSQNLAINVHGGAQIAILPAPATPDIDAYLEQHGLTPGQLADPDDALEGDFTPVSEQPVVKRS